LFALLSVAEETQEASRLAKNTSQPYRPRAILTAHVSILSEC
jgi:hypothetical protein